MGFVRGESRSQGALFPVSLDEWIPEDHLVRVIDLWVDRADVGRLGFAKAQPKGTGRPPYDPADLLKLYLYGYLNQIRSSRKLERESQRNLEVLWLLKRLTPDFKTIANFRRENGAAFSAACRAFVGFCRGERLMAGELVAIDGSKFLAVASKRRVIRRQQLVRQLTVLDADIARYLAELDAADYQEQAVSVPDTQTLRQTLARLKDQRNNVATAEALMASLGIDQHVQGEPEARLMKTAHGPTRVAYNVQTAVDAEHGLILHHEVTQDASDNRQLEPMARAAKAVLEQETLTVVADAGYSNGEQLSACDQANITAFVPPNQAINNQGEGQLFQKDRFIFDAEQDCYRCPAGTPLTRKQVMNKDRMVIYTTTACSGCSLKAQCTQAKQRFVSRHFDEQALEAARSRCAANPKMMKTRCQIVEHPFGNLKDRIFGNARFLLRGLAGVKGEMALAVLAYNFKRVSNILGIPALMACLAAA
jgi:transposase